MKNKYFCTKLFICILMGFFGIARLGGFFEPAEAFELPGKTKLRGFLEQVHTKKHKERPSLDTRQGNYIEIKEELNLNKEELETFDGIRAREEKMLRDFALDLETKYLRLDELNRVECRFYQRSCKKELKKDKQFLDDDIKELKRQIWQKKEYFKILYLNATTRAQDAQLRQMIFNETKGKMWKW